MPGRTIYEKLASAFTEEQAVLYNQRVEEISPNIRYCAYNIGERGCAGQRQAACGTWMMALTFLLFPRVHLWCGFALMKRVQLSVSALLDIQKAVP